MARPEGLRPAQELRTPSSTIEEDCLRYLMDREGKLCTVEELEASLFPERPVSIGKIVRKIRTTYLGDRGSIVTLLSHSQKTHGYYFLSNGKEISSLSELGVSPFRDDSNGSAVLGLSVLSAEIDKNPLIKPSVIISLFDQLSPKDSQDRQRPCLTPSERRVLGLLVENNEGVSTESFLKLGVRIDPVDLVRDRAIVSNILARLRQKIEGLGKIYRLPSSSKSEENGHGEARYFLIGEEQVGAEIEIPLEEREIFDSLAEPVREKVEEFCSRFITGGRLGHSLDEPQRRILYFLASKLGVPCSMAELAKAVYPSVGLSRDSLKALIVNKRKVQRALEGSDFIIISIPRCYEVPGLSSAVGAYFLGDRVALQEEKMLIPFLFSGEFYGIETDIRQKIRKMCQLTVAVRNKNGGLIRRRTVIPFEERKLLLALARSFPEGCSLRVLASNSIPEERNYNARKAIINRVIILRKKIETDFLLLEISVEYDREGDQYRLEVQK
jgi:DNA-binding winged helix-turn-helix (wHTH) protein